MTSIRISVRTADIILFVGCFGLAIVAFSVTSTFPSPFLPGYPGSAMFPRLVLIAMGIIAAFGLLRTVLSRRTEAAEATLEVPLAAFASIIAVIFGFAATLTLLGMEVAVFLMISGCLYFRNRSLLVALGAGLASVVVVYIVFVQALSVHLPLTILPRYLSGF